MRSFINLLFRVIKRNKLFSFLNIAGLAVGMASFIIIVLWVSDELSYDKFHENSDRIVRIKSYFYLNGEEGYAPQCPAPLAEAAVRDYPEVETAVRLRNYGSFIVEYDNKVFDEPDFIFADSTFFRIFSFPLIKGNPDKVLKARNTVAISESVAKKYFGDEDPLGKMFKLDNRMDVEVTGVYEDMPTASHFHFDFVVSLYTYGEESEGTWLSNNFTTYLLLSPNVRPEDLEPKLANLVEKYVSEQAAQALGMSWREIKESGTSLSYYLTRITDIHLRSGVEGDFEGGGSMAAVRIFGIIALFIIIIACINFTNLSTARSITRLREVGVRKTYGVSRSQLINQFNAESVIIVFIAFILAMVMVELSLPYFNDLTSKDLAVNYFSGKFIFSVLGMILIISVMAGAYPSLYLSSFRPIHVLKGDAELKKNKFSFRSILVVIQFFISLVLLSSTLILSKQMRYMQNKDLGFDKEEVMVINNTYLITGDQITTFKEELKKHPSIKSVSVSGFLPIPSNRNNSSIFPDAVLSDDLFNCQNWTVDYDYIETYGLRLSEGRNFSVEFPTDSMSLIINETAARKLGWDEPVGRFFGVPHDYRALGEMKLDKYTVIGVVEDFHFESLHLPIESQVFFLGRSASRTSLRLNSNIDLESLLTDLEQVWNTFAPGQPFSYNFIDQRLNQRYESERQLGKILTLFTIFAFFVSCLGLIGLSVFSSEQRKKEIGLRKVNGSGIGQIIWLLSVDFTRLVAISFAVSIPVTVIFMKKWLDSFAYRTELSWWIFGVTFLMTYAVAMIAIIFQSYQAASANPVDTFRTE
ncbi:MAG: ABC transporter permease [Marinilabiliaceae bacterium]|jgi:putative ABC transport system permease protein|nr:ABC transporter permease [Marinilabiliaceae bacterium]